MSARKFRKSDALVSHPILAPVAAGLSYFALAVAMPLLMSQNGSVSIVWPGDAVVLAILLHRPRSEWSSILLASVIGNIASNLLIPGTFAGFLMFGIAHMVDVLIAALVLSRSVRQDGLIRNPHTLARFLLWAGLIAPAASALCGATVALAMFDQPFVPSLITWMLADSLGQMIITPFLFALLGGEYHREFAIRPWSQRVEAVALLALTVLVTLFALTRNYPVMFLIYMPVMLVTFRLNWLGTKLAIMIVAIIGTVSIMCNVGPLPLLFESRTMQAFCFQFYLAAMLLTTYPIAATLTAHRKLMQELGESESSLRLLASQSAILLLNFDLSGVCQKALGASERLLGREPETLAGRSFGDISEEGNLELRAAHGRAIDEPGSVQSVEFRAFRVNGKWLEATFRISVDDKGHCLGTLATVHDITERKHQELVLARSATTDSLTGLLNRAGFMGRLEMAMTGAPFGAMSLAMIDVDRFKLINDNAGHQAGDSVLREIADRIADEIRTSDVAGRLGGDEFVILLATPDWEKAQDICRRVVEVVGAEAIALPSGEMLRTAISCGIAQYRQGLSAEEFLHEADLALYEAKRSGRNRMVAA